MGRQKGESARSKSRPSSSRFVSIPNFNFQRRFWLCVCIIDFFLLNCSLAASLLSSGSGAAAVGFGGFVGSSRLDPLPSSSEDSLPFVVCVSSSMQLFLFAAWNCVSIADWTVSVALWTVFPCLIIMSSCWFFGYAGCW